MTNRCFPSGVKASASPGNGEIFCSNFRTHTIAMETNRQWHIMTTCHTTTSHLLLLQILAVPQGLSRKKKSSSPKKKMDPNIKAEHGQNGTYNKQKWMNVRLWSGGLDGAAGGDESRNQQHMNKCIKSMCHSNIRKLIAISSPGCFQKWCNPDPPKNFWNFGNWPAGRPVSPTPQNFHPPPPRLGSPESPVLWQASPVGPAESRTWEPWLGRWGAESWFRWQRISRWEKSYLASKSWQIFEPKDMEVDTSDDFPREKRWFLGSSR